MGMSRPCVPADRREAVVTSRVALNQGTTPLGTADMYHLFPDEELVGEAIDGRWDEVALTTRVPCGVASDGSQSVNGQPDYVRAAWDESLSRLAVLSAPNRSIPPCAEEVGSAG